MVTRSDPEFFLGEEKVEYTQYYTYLGVMLTRPQFSLQEVVCAHFSCGYTVLLRDNCTYTVPRVANKIVAI